MKYLGTIYTAIALICFTAVLALYDNVLSLFAIQGNPSMSLWVKTVAAIGIYAFLFQFLMFLSDRMIRKLLSSEAKINDDDEREPSPIEGEISESNVTFEFEFLQEEIEEILKLFSTQLLCSDLKKKVFIFKR